MSETTINGTNRTRESGIGSTDISAIMGLNPWRGPFQVWLEKTGQAEPIVPNIPMRAGIALESLIAEMYAEQTGYGLIKLQDGATVIGMGLHICSPDRLIQGQPGGLEIKTASSKTAWGEPGTDKVPEQYLMQCLWCMDPAAEFMGTAIDWWDLAVMWNNRGLGIYRIIRDDGIIKTMDDFANEWWTKHIIGGVPPEADGSPGTTEYLKKMFPRNELEMIDAPDDIEATVINLYTTKTRIKQLEADQAMYENRIKQKIGLADGMIGSWGKITWRTNKEAQKTDWQAVARAAGATSDLIAAHTETKPGARVLRLTYKDGE